VKVVRYARGGEPAYGVLDDDGNVRALHGSPFERPEVGGVVAPAGQVRLLAPVLPSKILGVGSNYTTHTTAEPPPFPFFFFKPPSALVGPDDDVVYPASTERVDYEGELTVVIGKPARFVSEADALSYVLGYTVGNDVSARDWQQKEMQLGTIARGKGFDTFCPLGPAIATGLDPDDLTIVTRVNGRETHRVSTRDMIYKVATLVADASQAFTLLPGDVILTGTTAAGTVEPGDVVEIEIEGIGTLRNPVVREQRR
jgi:2-keto-4-pentenoate hydratase/2-oxohepta-3-ene-1,7-dioic acid hydratase in catechol pathway